MKPTVIKYFISIFLSLLGITQGYAQKQEKDILQYQVNLWNSEHGLSANAILSLTQSKDLYIWIGTFEGIWRFDGVKFERIDNKKGEIFSTPAFYEIYEDSKGRIWFGSNGNGIGYYQNHETIKIQNKILDKEAISQIHEDRKGNLWIATRTATFIYNVETNEAHPFLLNHTENVPANHFFEDHNENLWIASETHGLLQVKDGKLIRQFSQKDNLPADDVNFITEGQDNELWVGTGKGLARLVDGKLEKMPIPIFNDAFFTVEALYWDKQNEFLWVGGYQGLCYYKNGKFQKLEGFDQTNIKTIYKDIEGNIWIGTYYEGVAMLKKRKFACFSEENGLVNDIVNVITQDEKGNFWIGTDRGISIWDRKKFINYGEEEGVRFTRVRDILVEKDGSKLIASYGGVMRFQQGNITEEKYINDRLPVDRVRRLYRDKENNLWVGTRQGVMVFYPSGVVRTFKKGEGLTDDYVLCIVETHKGISIGTNGGGVNFYKNGKFTSLSQAEGLLNGIVFDIYEDSDKNIWLGTNGGISLLKNNILFSFSEKQGLCASPAFQIIEDSQGYFWITGNTGIFKVFKDDLLSVASGATKKVACDLFNKTDGLKTNEMTAAGKGTKTQEGEIFFQTHRGIATINPSIFTLSPNPPPVYIEEVNLGDTTIEINTQNRKIDIAPEMQHIKISFTALHYSAPNKILFKYRLYPFEEEWITLTNHREVQYTNLPAGEYTFQVIARNNDGVWNEEGDSIVLIQHPYFYNTLTFYFFVLGVVLSGAWGLYILRIKQLSINNEILERKVADRTRRLQELAQELSDQAQKTNEAYKKLSDSVKYAKRLQDAMLPNEDILVQNFEDSFILYLPKDIVSGDFFWIEKIDHQVFIIVGDCTGHGVPGAFMTVMATGFLSKIIREEGMTNPSEILHHLDDDIHKVFSQKSENIKIADGMDIGVCVIDTENKEIIYAGAKSQCFFMHQNEFRHIKGNKYSIGKDILIAADKKVFQNIHISYQAGDKIYMFTDGFADQFGEQTDRKYLISNMREFIKSVSTQKMPQQKKQIEAEIKQWRGKKNQTDDISMIGIMLR